MTSIARFRRATLCSGNVAFTHEAVDDLVIERSPPCGAGVSVEGSHRIEAESAPRLVRIGVATETLTSLNEYDFSCISSGGVGLGRCADATGGRLGRSGCHYHKVVAVALAVRPRTCFHPGAGGRCGQRDATVSVELLAELPASR